MRRTLTLPLGIDIGSTRIRVASARMRNGRPRVEAIASRDRQAGTLPASPIAEALKELRVDERRCVMALGMPPAELRLARQMPPLDSSSAETLVRWHTIDRRAGLYAIGTVNSAALHAKLSALANTPLRVVAVDHESLALRRALPDYRAVIDIGYARVSVHFFDGPLPRTLTIATGGRDITLQIARELCIDARTAERRKLIYGATGAGEKARDRLLARIAHAIQSSHDEGAAQRIALVGNGAQLANLADDLRRACNCAVDIPESALLQGLPTSVRVRSAGSDWNLVAGLSLWASAA